MYPKLSECPVLPFFLLFVFLCFCCRLVWPKHLALLCLSFILHQGRRGLDADGVQSWIQESDVELQWINQSRIKSLNDCKNKSRASRRLSSRTPANPNHSWVEAWLTAAISRRVSSPPRSETSSPLTLFWLWLLFVTTPRCHRRLLISGQLQADCPLPWFRYKWNDQNSNPEPDLSWLFVSEFRGTCGGNEKYAARYFAFWTLVWGVFHGRGDPVDSTNCKIDFTGKRREATPACIFSRQMAKWQGATLQMRCPAVIKVHPKVSMKMQNSLDVVEGFSPVKAAVKRFLRGLCVCVRVCWSSTKKKTSHVGEKRKQGKVELEELEISMLHWYSDTNISF